MDDTTSYGPETITVKQMATEGKYSYYVHDFSNRGSSSSTALSASGAKVEVYVADTLVYTFSVPSNSGGTCWHVFDYDAAAGLIIPVNTFSYVSNPASVASLDAVSAWTDAEWNDIIDLLNLPEKESDMILTDEESSVPEEEWELIELDLSDAGTETETESEIETEASSESEEMSETVMTETEAEMTTSGDMEEMELSIDAVNPDSGELGASDASEETVEDIIIVEE